MDRTAFQFGRPVPDGRVGPTNADEAKAQRLNSAAPFPGRKSWAKSEERSPRASFNSAAPFPGRKRGGRLREGGARAGLQFGRPVPVGRKSPGMGAGVTGRRPGTFNSAAPFPGRKRGERGQLRCADRGTLPSIFGRPVPGTEELSRREVDGKARQVPSIRPPRSRDGRGRGVHCGECSILRPSIRPPRSRDGRGWVTRPELIKYGFLQFGRPVPGTEEPLHVQHFGLIGRTVNSAAPFPGRKSNHRRWLRVGDGPPSIRPPRSRDGRAGGVPESEGVRKPRFGRPVPGTEELPDWPPYAVEDTRCPSIRPPRSRDGKSAQWLKQASTHANLHPAAPFPGRKSLRRRP